jgi:hypothetical protein
MGAGMEYPVLPYWCLIVLYELRSDPVEFRRWVIIALHGHHALRRERADAATVAALRSVAESACAGSRELGSGMPRFDVGQLALCGLSAKAA